MGGASPSREAESLCAVRGAIPVGGEVLWEMKMGNGS